MAFHAFSLALTSLKDLQETSQAGKLPYCLYKIFNLSHGDHFFESKRVTKPGKKRNDCEKGVVSCCDITGIEFFATRCDDVKCSQILRWSRDVARCRIAASCVNL